MASPINSPLVLNNDFEFMTEGRWKWSAWVEGPTDELSTVDFVTYRLHPTFANPVIRIKDPEGGFRLQASGWGEFRLVADVTLRDGSICRLEKWVELGNGAADKPDGRPSVYISHSIVDGILVEELSQELNRQGLQILTADQFTEPKEGVESSIAAGIDAADMVVVLFSDPPSPFVEREAHMALKTSKLLPILLGHPKVPAEINSVERLSLSESGSVRGLASTIAARVKDKVTPGD